MKREPQIEQFWKASDLAEKLGGVSPRTIINECKAGRLKYKLVGNIYLIPESEFQEWQSGSKPKYVQMMEKEVQRLTERVSELEGICRIKGAELLREGGMK